MLLSKKWLKNHPKFLLHFLIHIDVLMLCSKFEPIPTSIFRVMTTFKKLQILEKNHCTIVHAFFQKMAKNHPKFLLHFLIHTDVLMLCSKFEMIIVYYFFRLLMDIYKLVSV